MTSVRANSVLFIGGTAHGEHRSVPDGIFQVVIPVPPPAASYKDSQRYESHCYILHTFFHQESKKKRHAMVWNKLSKQHAEDLVNDRRTIEEVNKELES